MSELFVFVEGFDDEMFFNRILKAKLGDRYDNYRVITYAEMKSDKLLSYLKTAICCPDYDYVYIADSDGRSDKDQLVLNKYPLIEPDKVHICKFEIESWIIAGVQEEQYQQLRERFKFNSTEEINKELFNKFVPLRSSRIEFIQDILSRFDFEKSRTRNKSLDSTVSKLLIQN